MIFSYFCQKRFRGITLIRCHFGFLPKNSALVQKIIIAQKISFNFEKQFYSHEVRSLLIFSLGWIFKKGSALIFRTRKSEQVAPSVNKTVLRRPLRGRPEVEPPVNKALFSKFWWKFFVLNVMIRANFWRKIHNFLISGIPRNCSHVVRCVRTCSF